MQSFLKHHGITALKTFLDRSPGICLEVQLALSLSLLFFLNELAGVA